MNQDFELLISILIAAGSVVLFGYWFRYACLLLLTAKTPWDYARGVAAFNRLSFLEVRARLAEAGQGELGRLGAALDRDYYVLLYLLRHTSPRAAGESSIERRMLEVYYCVLRVWFSASRRVSDELARAALQQMCCIVADFANTFGARVAGT